MRVSDDFKQGAGMKPARKYVSVGKYVRRRNDVIWRFLGEDYTAAAT